MLMAGLVKEEEVTGQEAKEQEPKNKANTFLSELVELLERIT